MFGGSTAGTVRYGKNQKTTSMLTGRISWNGLISADKVTLQITWKNQFQYASCYVARELGFYDDASGALCIH